MGHSDNMEAIAYEIAFWSQAIDNPDYPNEDVGTVALEVSEKFRTLAILLLLTGDHPAFCFNLSRSGQARMAYLKRMLNAGINSDHHLASGRFAPLLDAIAAGDMETATAIVKFSPVEHQIGHEYEDDYCFAQIVHALVSNCDNSRKIESMLDRFEGCLGADADVRPDVCKAIFFRNQELFDEAFRDFLNSRSEQLEQDEDRGQIESTIVAANRMVYIDALAFLRLAERSGLKTESEYLYCPSFARALPQEPFPREWLQ